MRKLLSLFAIWTMLLSQSPAQVQMDRINVKGINGNVYPSRFGAAGNGSTDDTTAINNANNAAAAGQSCLVFDAVTYATTGTVAITAPCVKNNGAVILYSGTGAAVTVDENAFDNTSTHICDLDLPSVERPSKLWSSGSPSTDSGILILDANACNIKIPNVKFFTNGLDLSPSAHGVARNNFSLGKFNTNMRQIRFCPTTSSGFVNQNGFFGGYLAWDFSLGWAVPGTRDILMCASTDQVTSNTFYHPDLEGQVAEYMWENWGAYNVLITPELENPATRSVSDATVNSGSPTITLTAGDVAAGKGFNANADVGQTVTGGLFPVSTTILSVTSTTVATASANATSNGSTVTISSAPRIAYRNSGGNNAIQNAIYGGFPNGSLVVTKDVGTVSNMLFGAGGFNARWGIMDGNDPGVGRGFSGNFGTGTYATGGMQWAVHLDNKTADGSSLTEGAIGACGPNMSIDFCTKVFVDDANTITGIKSNTGASYFWTLSEGANEFFRFDPGGSTATTIGLNGGAITLRGVKTTIGGRLNQSGTNNFAGSCAMAAGTTCTATLAASFTSQPVCIATPQSSAATPPAGACLVNAASTTVTITAASSNSLTWGYVVIGNPN